MPEDIDQLFSSPTDAALLERAHRTTEDGVEAIHSSDSEKASIAVSDAMSLLCKALARDRPKVAVAAARGLATVYATPQVRGPLRLEIAAALSTAGGLAVRLEDWAFIRRLALLPSGVPPDSRDQPYLVPHARLQAAREGLLPANPDRPLIDVANTWAVEHEDARPDLPAANGRVLDSICQFNALASLIHFDVNPEFGFPEFRRYESRRTDSVIEVVVTDQDVRRQLLGSADDARVASLLRAVAAFGREYFFQFGVWHGFESRRVNELLRANEAS